MLREPRQRLVRRYAVAVISSLAALLLSIALHQVIESIIFIFFFAALFVSIFSGGFGPGVVVVLIGVTTVNYFLMPPLNAWSFSPLDVLRMGFFATVALTASWLAEKRLRAEAKALIAERRRLARQKDLEQALVDTDRSRAQLEAVFQAVTEGIAVCNMQGEFVFMNEAQARINGFSSADEMLQKLSFFADLYELTELDGRAIPLDKWPVSRVLRGESIDSWELRGRRRDTGQEWFFEFSGQPVKDSGGNQVLALVVTRDITAHKRRERALEVSEERFRTMADNIPQLAWMAERDGRITWYNRRWFEFTGTRLEEMIGEGWHKVHHPDHIERVIAKFKAHIASGETWEDLFPLQKADGGWRWFLSRAVPVRDEKSRVVRWFGTNTDVTEQRETELTLLRQTAELEQFAYIASHDLKEPLRKISSYADLLTEQHGDQLGEEAGRYLDHIRRSTLRMKTLIEDLLAYSAIERTEETWSEVDLNETALEAAEDVQSDTERRQLAVVVEPLPHIRGSAVLLRQLFQNLFSNTLKFRGNEAPRVRVFGQETDAEVRVGVRDNGIGIAPEYHESIFKMFHRLHTQHKIPGTGIGLAVCKRIVEQHGGRIWVESNEQTGATFWFALPKTASGHPPRTFPTANQTKENSAKRP